MSHVSFGEYTVHRRGRTRRKVTIMITHVTDGDIRRKGYRKEKRNVP